MPEVAATVTGEPARVIRVVADADGARSWTPICSACLIIGSERLSLTEAVTLAWEHNHAEHGASFTVVVPGAGR